MTEQERIVGELLTILERREAALMDWGFFDVVHTAGEIIALFESDPQYGKDFSDLAHGSEELFIDDLADAKLLHRLEGSYPRLYRSRFAESVRLMARLRQRFKEDDWAHAPELVSQVRLHLAARRFPVRNQGFDQAWAATSSAAWLPKVQYAVLQALTTRPKPMRLAPFQVRAASRILAHYRGAADPGGTVVTAGTGGGKTKAFYIPAFMGIAADLVQDPAPATRVLALYPRNVLLADQFSEAAAQASIVNSLHFGRRPVRVGALIGNVPLNARFERDGRNASFLGAWRKARHQVGHVVPHLRHPDTGEDLVWAERDRLAGRTSLRKDTPVGEVVFEDGVVCLTREELLQSPPDIFLTSIEMLNKELSSEIGRAVLGFGTGDSALRLVLLDEIHTYEGITGAQVPWILRRLAYWVRPARRTSSLHYVGLSATLQDAPSHLAMLTGVAASRVEEIAPRGTDDEMSVEGQEYNVVLKSHPGSGAGVLSTSIQAAMLGARLLTPAGARRVASAPVDPTTFFGRKVFGFTDNLDVVNRWLPDFKNAEEVRRLARLRQPREGDDLQEAAGQIWRLSTLLGHDLHARLRVDRISSQDPGLEAKADVVFATSSLEVGYDDPDVGMVLQHKAPRSAASFLQRKGRAGRRQGVRPWTVVVLSDHGRDRWAFRDSERLFSPVLERLVLPVFNPYLLRIQATWFLVDWISYKVGSGVPSLYLTRAGHADARAEALVEDLLDNPELREEFSQALMTWLTSRSGGFRVTDPSALARSILWSPPRAVLRHVVPDLAKQMLSGYPVQGRRSRLLPRFLPATTWDVLDAQDVELLIGPDQVEIMDAGRALYETTPGRVSRRFVVDPREPSKWPAMSSRLVSGDPVPTLSVDELCGNWVRVDELDTLTLYQPTQMAFADVPAKVKNSSNAQWAWELQVRRTGRGGELGVHTEGVLARLFDASRAWLHRDQSPLRVFRFAKSCRFEILMERDEVHRGRLQVAAPCSADDAGDVAIGFARAVDGLEFRIRPDCLAQAPDLPAEMLRDLMPAYLRYRAVRSDLLQGLASSFSINNLCTSAIGMVVATALNNRLELSAAWKLIPDKAAAALKVMRTVLSADSEGEEDDNRRLKELADLWRLPQVAAEMDGLVRLLWEPFDAGFAEWLRLKLVETVRAAVEAAVQAILPEAPDGNIRIEAVTDEFGTSIVVLENDAGGVGIVERLLLEITASPDHFSRAVQWAIETCASEDVTHIVQEAVRAARPRHTLMRSAFEEVRSASDYQALEHARGELIAALRYQDLPAGKQVVTALMSKALAPGSYVETDRWLDGLARARLRAGQRIGTTIDVRAFAYWLAHHPRAAARMRATVQRIVGCEPVPAQVYQAFTRLTLEACTDTCPECLGTAGEATGMAPSRRLVRHWLGPVSHLHIVDVDDEGTWAMQLELALRSHTQVRLRHTAAQRSVVAAVLAARLATEVDRGFHSSPLRIAAVRRNAGLWETDVEVDPWEVS